MTELSEIQARLTELLQRRRAIVSDEASAQVAAWALTGNDRLSPAEQLEIYREQFWLRHTSSLLEDFPGLSGVVGQRAWEQLVESYLAAHPPQSFTLRDLGAQLPEFVAKADFLEHRELCTDMARLEWAYVEAFDAADAPALDPAQLATIPPEKWPGARLVLDPALRLLRLNYPVASLRLRLKSSGDAPVELPERRPHQVVVYRRAGGLFHDEVSDAAFELLSEFRAERTLGDALEFVMQRVADPQQVAGKLQDWFRKWAAAGWFTRVDHEPS